MMLVGKRIIELGKQIEADGDQKTGIKVHGAGTLVCLAAMQLKNLADHGEPLGTGWGKKLDLSISITHDAGV